MKRAREIKVALLAIVALFLLYFGFNYLKGTNVFHSVNEYQGRFETMNGLVEQAGVFIRGYKVGQVDRIQYDFSADSAFLVSISVSKDIVLPKGTEMVLMQDGVLGGAAIELRLAKDTEACPAGSFLPTSVAPGLIDEVKGELMGRITVVMDDVDSVIRNVSGQLEGDHLASILRNVDSITGSLTGVGDDLSVLSSDLKRTVPGVIAKVDRTLDTVDSLAVSVDVTVGEVQEIVAGVKDGEGTVGKLLKDKSLYNNIDHAVVSVDSLLTDLKANPKRYVHFSLFGRSKNKK